MGREMTLAGFRMSKQEWLELDEHARLQFLQVFIETSPPRADQWVYESYELSIDLSR
jgi:hypothetical protein